MASAGAILPEGLAHGLLYDVMHVTTPTRLPDHDRTGQAALRQRRALADRRRQRESRWTPTHLLHTGGTRCTAMLTCSALDGRRRRAGLGLGDLGVLVGMACR